MIHKKGAHVGTIKQRTHLYMSTWYRRNSHAIQRRDILARSGLRFIIQKYLRKENYCAITCEEIEFDDGSKEEIYEVDTYDDQPMGDKLVPKELEDGGQAPTMDELKEVIWGLKKICA